MRYIIIFFFTSNVVFAQTWNLIWSDEFNGNNLDTNYWSHEIGTGSQNGLYGWGNGELQYYQPQNSVVNNGTLKIIAQQEPNGLVDSWNNTYYYSSSRIVTRDKFEFQYGKIAARIKTLDGQGYWPAFWLLPKNGQWPCDGEIDIMEQWGNNGPTNVTTGAAHVGVCPYSSSNHQYQSSSYQKNNGSFADNFHTYEIIWRPNKIEWFVDGTKFFEVDSNSFNQIYAWPFNSNQWYLILNLAITSSGPSLSTVFPNQIEVDYVRIYEEIGGISGCTDSLAFNYNPNATVNDSSCEYQVTFNLDMNTYSSSFTKPEIGGTFNNWCGSCAQMHDNNGDNIWEKTIIIKEGFYQYLFVLDNWTVQESLSTSLACVMSSYGFTNRILDLSSDTILDVVCWESCSECFTSNNHVVNFNLDMNCSGINPTFVAATSPNDGWSCGGGIILSDSDGDGVWSATANFPISDTHYEYIYCADNWSYSESAGLINSMQNGANCAPVTNYSTYANRLITLGNITLNDTWGSCISCQYGCTDSTAINYFPGANVDDGSCIIGTTCSGSPITNLGVTNIIHNRATFTFDDMNSSTCRVDQLRIKYREVGTTAWSQKNMGSPTGYDPVTGICNSTSRTDKLVLGLSANTTYEWQMRVWYCSTGATAWVNGPNFTTLADCPNVGNLAVTTPTNTKATFTWDNSNGAYSFVRLQARVDTTGSSFFNIGGVGVLYGTYTKDKNGLVPGTTYRAKSRTWCDPNGGAYKAPSWTSFIYFTMPGSVRLDGGTSIESLDVYPNPSRDIFNVSFTSKEAQDLEVRVINVVGEVVYTEGLENFTGEYAKEIDLVKYTKGIYFLEITTNSGVINKKVILI